jgi:hypothetical protein
LKVLPRSQFVIAVQRGALAEIALPQAFGGVLQFIDRAQQAVSQEQSQRQRSPPAISPAVSAAWVTRPSRKVSSLRVAHAAFGSQVAYDLPTHL